MSDFDANFKVKTPIIPHKLPGNKPQLDGHLDCLPTSTFTLSNPRVCICTHLCVHMRVCLFGFFCRYVHVWVNANGGSVRYKNSHADRPGLRVRVSHVKTQTGWVCNESDERSWCHTASSGLKRQSTTPTLVWKLTKSVEMVDNCWISQNSAFTRKAKNACWYFLHFNRALIKTWRERLFLQIFVAYLFNLWVLRKNCRFQTIWLFSSTVIAFKQKCQKCKHIFSSRFLSL